MNSMDLGNSKLSDDDDSGISVEIEDEVQISINRMAMVNREKHSESAVPEIDTNNNINEITKLMTCIVNQTIIDSNQSSSSSSSSTSCSSSMSEQEEPKPLLMIIDQNSTESSIISSTSFSLESNAKTIQYGSGGETFASLSISNLNADQSMTSTISCSSSPKSEVATTMLATARSSSSVSLATGAATPTNSSYLPNSPAESSSPMDDIQPLDFSTSKTTVSKRFPQTPRMEDPADDSDQAEEADDIYHNVYRKTSKHLLDKGPVALTNQSDQTKSSKLSSKFNEQHCFTTPSPSPPERHHIHTNMPPHHNYNIMTMLNGADLSNNQYHRQQQSRQSPPPSQLALSQPHLPTGAASANNNSAAAVAAAATNELMQTALVSALMQSASLNPAMVNAEFIQNLAQNASNLMAANPSLAKSLTSPNRTALAAATASSSPFLVKNGDNHLISPKLTSPNSVNFPNTLTSSSSQPSMNSAAMVAAAGLLTTASNNTNSSLPFSLHHSIPVDSSSTTNSSKKNSYQSNVNFSPQHPIPSQTNSTSSKYSRSSKSQYKNNKQQQPTSQHSSHPISPNNNHNNQSQLFSPTAPMPSVGTDALANQSILLSNSDPAYQEFRKQMLKSKRSSSGSRSSSTKRNSSGGKANSVDLHSDDNSNCSSSGEGEGSVNSMNSLSNATGGNGSIYGGDFQQSNLNAMMNSGMTHSMMGMSQSVTPPPTSMTTATSAITTSTDSSNGGGSGSGRKRGRPLPHYMKDDAYWERRRKNNEAAKRSRDLRRAKEDEIAIRCAFLEHENFRLKCELMQTRVEYDKVRALWLNTAQGSQQAESGQFPPALSGSNATLMNAEFMQSLAQNPSIAKSLSPLNPNSSTSSTATNNNNSPFHFKHEPQSPPASQRFSSSPNN